MINNEKIKWCLKQNKGIKLVEPNDNISKNYIKESSGDFEMIAKSDTKWKSITSYYSCYNMLYAILIKIGIKCEIHDCSLCLMEILGFEKKEIDFMSVLKKERINMQYYLKHADMKINEKDVVEFINKCKEIIFELNDIKINNIRNKIKQIIKQNDKQNK